MITVFDFHKEAARWLKLFTLPTRRVERMLLALLGQALRVPSSQTVMAFCELPASLSSVQTSSSRGFQ